MGVVPDAKKTTIDAKKQVSGEMYCMFASRFTEISRPTSISIALFP